MENNIKTFWSSSPSSKGRTYDINFKELYEVLEHHGFRTFKKPGSNGKITLVKFKNYILEEVDKSELQKFPVKYVEKNSHLISQEDEPEKIIEKYRRTLNSLFSENQILMLKELEFEFKRDDKNTSHVYFKNCFYLITKDSIIRQNYSELDELIWRSDIVDFELEITSEKPKCIFYEFLVKISKNKERLSTLESITGYLLHSYNNPSFPKVVVLNDEEISNYPNGGTGKGLYVQGLKKIRKTVVIDAKNQNLKSNFAFQQVNYGDKLLFLDDITKDFNFEMLFSLTTEGIAVEKKHQGKFLIPFKDSPKTIITTNYVIREEGESVNRRKIEFEFSDYFSKTKSPEKEFGTTFFSEEWDNNEWTKFYSYLIFCIQDYISNGIAESAPINLERKRLILNSSVEFIEFMDNRIDREKFYPNNIFRINRKSLLEDFRKEYEGYSSFSSRKFYSWVKYYCQKKEYPYEETKSDDKYFFNIRVDKT